MSNLLYLLIAVGLSAAGMLVLWWRTRTPTSPTSTIDEFNEKMRALAPGGDPDGSTDRVVRRRRRET